MAFRLQQLSAPQRGKIPAERHAVTSVVWCAAVGVRVPIASWCHEQSLMCQVLNSSMRYGEAQLAGWPLQQLTRRGTAQGKFCWQSTLLQLG